MKKIFFALFFSLTLEATDYIFPDDLLGLGCFLIGTDYQCVAPLDFGNNDTIDVTSDINLVIGSNFTAGNGLVITTSGNVLSMTLGGFLDVGNNLDATTCINVEAGSNIEIGNNGTIQGTLQSNTGTVTLGNNTTNTACSGTPSSEPVADFYFDECEWDGSVDEVLDSTSNNFHGRSINGANTDAQGQVERSGYFDGVNDYIEQDEIYDTLRSTASLSFWIRTTQNGNDTSWAAPGIAGIEESGGGDDIFWGWIDASGHIGLTKGNLNTVKSNTAINDDIWHHVALTWDSGSGFAEVYVDGALEDTGITESGDVGNNFNRIGSILDTVGTPTYLEGNLDELKIYDSIIDATTVQSIYTNELAGNNYDGSARNPVNCSTCGTYSGSLASIQLVGDQITLLDTYQTPQMTSVTYKDNYVFSENPVIFVLPDTRGGNPANMRVKNVDSRGFDIAIVEPQGEDGAHISMNVDYFAVNVGDTSTDSASQVYSLGNELIEVGYIKTNKVQKGYDIGTNEWEIITPKGNFCNPVVVTQIQGMVNEPSYNPSNPSTPFLTVATEISGTDIKLALERSETNTGTVAQPEVIAYMISEANIQDSFVDNDNNVVLYETIQTNKIFYGWSDSAVSTNFINTYNQKPLVAASLNSRDSRDGGWFRKRTHTNTRISLVVDEDRLTGRSGGGSVQDNERSKTLNTADGNPTTPESAGIFVFDGTFVLTGDVEKGTINAVNVVEKDIFDGNISTQIAGSLLDLALVAREDDNVTKRDADIVKLEIINCVDDLCLDCAITTDAIPIFDNIAAPIQIEAAIGYKLLSDAGVTYTMPSAKKIQKLRITESGESPTCSFDTFAIRPDRYDVSASNPAYAGENFSLNFRALDSSGVNTVEYNEEDSNNSFIINYAETRPECNAGETLNRTEVKFIDGASLNVDANFTGLAQFLNISILENLGNEFASIDADDTADSLRLIKSDDINISVLPYELNITSTQINTSTGLSWLYMADVNDMNVSTKVTVQANNKNNDVLQDFNASCYAQDVDIDFKMIVRDGSSILDMNYTSTKGSFLSTGTRLGDINQSLRISASEFSLGIGEAAYSFNVYRGFDTPVSPFEVQGLGADIMSTGVAKFVNNNADYNDGNFSFYYGRLSVDDTVTSLLPISNSVSMEVYDEVNSVYTQGMQRQTLFWYLNAPHNSNNEGSVLEAIASSNTLIDNTLGGYTFVYNPIGSGSQDIDINTASTSQATIHLKIQNWLWYTPTGFGSGYADGAGTDCSMHPCFKFTQVSNNSALKIESGDFNGTIVPDVNRSDYIKKGVKLFR